MLPPRLYIVKIYSCVTTNSNSSMHLLVIAFKWPATRFLLSLDGDRILLLVHQNWWSRFYHARVNLFIIYFISKIVKLFLREIFLGEVIPKVDFQDGHWAEKQSTIFWGWETFFWVEFFLSWIEISVESI